MTVLKSTTYSGNFSGTATKITLNTVSVERGMNWIDAVDIAMSHEGDYDGFYISKPVFNHAHVPFTGDWWRCVLFIFDTTMKQIIIIIMTKFSSGLKSKC